MEEYLQHMKNLRSQINDFEEQSASFSVEEEKQRSAIQSMEKDRSSVKSETGESRTEYSFDAQRENSSNLRCGGEDHENCESGSRINDSFSGFA